MQLAAIHALLNSLEFVRENFDREVPLSSLRALSVLIYLQGERNYIMQVVCEATQCQSVPVQVGAFECLVRIMSLYYDKMGFYMERALFGVNHHCHSHAHYIYSRGSIVDRYGHEAF